MSCPYCRQRLPGTRAWLAHVADPWRCPQRPAHPQRRHDKPDQNREARAA